MTATQVISPHPFSHPHLYAKLKMIFFKPKQENTQSLFPETVKNIHFMLLRTSRIK